MAREFRPGERLDPASLADSLSSSVTPVRDALHILTGERLVETRASDGFHVPQIDEPALKDLYEWNHEVLLTAMRAAQRSRLTSGSTHSLPSPGGDTADRTGDIFDLIGSLSTNVEHRGAIRSLNARLHAVRTIEPVVLGDVEAEIEPLAQAVVGRAWSEARHLTLSYHRRRRRAAAQLLRALYRAG